MADVGTGATITFGTSGFSASIISMEWGGLTREDVDTTHLGTTTAMTYIPGDLYDPGDLTITFQYDPDTQAPITAAAETITITYPIPSGLSSGATHAGTGYINSFTPGSLTVDELMEAEAVVKFSGAISFVDAS